MNKKGFSLIELLIVISIISILMVVAIPSYQSHVLATNRALAKAVLMDVASNQERFFLNNKAYSFGSDVLTNLGYPADYYIDNEGNTSSADDSIYLITLAATATSYTITATPQNGQAKDSDCTSLTLSETGSKQATGDRPDQCW